MSDEKCEIFFFPNVKRIPPKLEQVKIDIAMLESLATIYRMRAKGLVDRNMQSSFNDEDVAELFLRCVEKLKK